MREGITGPSLQASNIHIAILPPHEIESIVKFDEIVHQDCAPLLRSISEAARNGQSTCPTIDLAIYEMPRCFFLSSSRKIPHFEIL